MRVVYAVTATAAFAWLGPTASVPAAPRRRTRLSVTVPVPLEYAAELAATASSLVAPGKGVLASDESAPTLNDRLEAQGIGATEENRRRYRELLYTTPDLGDYVSGCILSADMLFEETAKGTPFVDVLNVQGIVPGVRVDAGTAPLPGAIAGETCSRGLDGLDERAALYREQGARFAKWRSKIHITEGGAPSYLALKENTWSMARCARTLQERGLVPILEPAVVADGFHSIERAAEVQERVYVDVFRALSENGVFLEGCLLKPVMTTPGEDCGDPVSPELVAAYSVRTLELTVPSAVPGVCFNSGALGEEEAAACLDAMNRIERKGPWSVTYGFARSLQASCLATWRGDDANAPAAQAALLARARAAGEANLGKYAPGSQPSTDATVGLRGWE